MKQQQLLKLAISVWAIAGLALSTFTVKPADALASGDLVTFMIEASEINEFRSHENFIPKGTITFVGAPISTIQVPNCQIGTFDVYNVIVTVPGLGAKRTTAVVLAVSATDGNPSLESGMRFNTLTQAGHCNLDNPPVYIKFDAKLI